MEYGKFTDGHGYAERRDHSELARSPQFPPVLAAYCGPRLVGPSRSEGEPMPSWAKHGTVLQPVLAGGAVFPLFARVVPTPERTANRIYLRARFVTDSGAAAPPDSLFAAMESQPLSEFVRGQSSTTVEPLTAAPLRRVLVDPGWVATAAACILAGSTVSIGASMAEREFFDLADAVWWTLPPALRPLFSAGWGCAPGLQGKLHLYCGAGTAPSGAQWDPASGEWQSGRLDGAERALAERALRLLYSGEPGSSPPDPELASLIDRLLVLPAAAAGLLQADSLQAVASFRLGARAIADASLIARYRRALGDAVGPALEPALFLRRYWLPTAIDAVLETVTDAVTQPETEGSAAWALGRWLETVRDTRDRIAARSGPGAERAAEFVRLLSQSPARLLRGLAAGPAEEPVQAWKREACVAVLRAAVRRLDSEGLAAHRALLLAAEPPPLYAEFLGRCALDLAVGIDKLGPADEDGLLLRILSLCPESAGVTILRSLACGDPVKPGCRKSLEGEPAVAEAVEARVRARWNRLPEFVPEERDRLLDWVLEYTHEGALPVADLARGGADHPSRVLDPAAVTVFAGEVAAGRVPPRLEASLASLVERNFEAFLKPLLEDHKRWEAIARHLPQETRWLCGFDLRPCNTPPNWAALRPENVERLVRYWAGRQADDLAAAGIASTLVWLGCQVPERSRTQTPASWLVKELWTRGWNFLRTGRPSIECAETVSAIYRALPQVQRLRVADDRPAALWRCAEYPEGLLLLLMLFPEVDFAPENGDLVRLSSEDTRPALRQYLARPTTSAARRTQFCLAAAEFHQWEYNERTFPEQRSVLWAAFRGVPMRLQFPLVHAIDHYAGTVRQALSLCEVYLDSTAPQERRLAANRVMEDFVLPTLWRDLKEQALVSGFLASVRQIESGREGNALPLSQVERPGSRMVEFWHFSTRFWEVDPKFLRLVQRVIRLRAEFQGF